MNYNTHFETLKNFFDFCNQLESRNLLDFFFSAVVGDAGATSPSELVDTGRGSPVAAAPDVVGDDALADAVAADVDGVSASAAVVAVAVARALSLGSQLRTCLDFGEVSSVWDVCEYKDTPKSKDMDCLHSTPTVPILPLPAPLLSGERDEGSLPVSPFSFVILPDFPFDLDPFSFTLVSVSWLNGDEVEYVVVSWPWSNLPVSVPDTQYVAALPLAESSAGGVFSLMLDTAMVGSDWQVTGLIVETGLWELSASDLDDSDDIIRYEVSDVGVVADESANATSHDLRCCVFIAEVDGALCCLSISESDSVLSCAPLGMWPVNA